MLGPTLLTGAALLAAAAIAALVRPRKLDGDRPPYDGPGLPPIDDAQAREAIRRAEVAAIRQALGAQTAESNPYAKGTRAHILWETHFHSVLLAWTEEH